jgi:putative transposase
MKSSLIFVLSCVLITGCKPDNLSEQPQRIRGFDGVYTCRISQSFCKYPGKKTHSLSEIFIHTDMYSEEIAMRKARFTEHQIIAVLKSVEAGRTVKDVCREAGISEASYYNWKAKYGGMEASDIKKLKDLEEENRRLKQMFADLSLECRALKDVIEKKL